MSRAYRIIAAVCGLAGFIAIAVPSGTATGVFIGLLFALGIVGLQEISNDRH